MKDNLNNPLISVTRLPLSLALAVTVFSAVVHAETPNVGSLLVKVVTPISNMKVLPSTTPIPGKTSTIVRLTAARGEFEPASIVVSAPGSKSTITALSISSSNLTSSHLGSLIPASAIDIRIVKPWFQSYYAWNEIGKASPEDFRATLIPELLLHDDALVKVSGTANSNSVRIIPLSGKGTQYQLVNPPKLAAATQVLPSVSSFNIRDPATFQSFTLNPGESRQIWLNAAIPTSIEPGTYTGTLSFRSNGQLMGKMTLLIDVLPFELSKPRLTYSIYYRAQLDNRNPSIGSERRNELQMRRELENIRDHGVTNPTIYQLPTDRSLLTRVLQLRKEVGLEPRILYYLGWTTRESLGSIQSYLPGLLSLFRSEGYKEIYIYGIDEAVGKTLVDQLPKFSAVQNMGAKTFVAGYDGTFEAVGNKLDLFIHAGKPDPKNGGKKPDPEQAAKWHTVGSKIYNYGNPQSPAENPLLWRVNYGIVLWAAGYDGAMPYAYQHCFGACWNDVDNGQYRDHMLTYPTADGVIDTIAWEGYREGIDDVRYITTLEQAIGKFITSSASEKAKLARQAQTYLDMLKSYILNEQQRAGKYNIGIALDPDAVRSDIIARIIALSV